MQALINETLDRLKRTSERLAVKRASTLRARDGLPMDVTIEDISLTGCRVRAPVHFAAGEELMIGLAGVGIRSCSVVWSDYGEIGCEFDVPLTSSELEETRIAKTLRHGNFNSVAFPVIHAPAPIKDERWGAGHGLLIIIAAAAVSWLLVVASYWMLAS